MDTNTRNGTMTRIRPTSAGGLLVVLASTVLSLVARGFLGERLRIRWTVGAHYHVGPEYVPTLAALVAFPVSAAVLYVGGHLLRRWLEAVEGTAETRSAYEAAVVGTLALLVVLQAALVLANVYL